MLVIRQFEDERKAWELEREELKQQTASLGSRKDEELARLREEVESLRAAKVQARALEQRASESLTSHEDLDCTRQIGSGPPHDPKELGGCGGAAASALHDELLDTRRSLERKHGELLNQEDETVRVREELNNEKQKVIELKRAARSRAAAWKEELVKITEEVMMKQNLEEEVTYLRAEQARFRKDLGLLKEQERAARQEAQRLQREVAEARAARTGGPDEGKAKVQEMEILSTVMGSQLIAVEQELTKQVRRSSELLERFLLDAREPLQAVRRSCWKIAASGDAGGEMWQRQAPPLFEAGVHDLRGGLRKIVGLLQFAADVLEARERQQAAAH